MLPKLISEDAPWLVEGGIELSTAENESVIIKIAVNFGNHHQGPSLDSIAFSRNIFSNGVITPSLPVIAEPDWSFWIASA